jgi:putative ABC transport system permease protein
VNGLGLAWRWLKRDLAAGELGVIALSLVVAVAAMCSVDFFTDRVRQALGTEANQLLAADLVVTSDHPLPANYAANVDEFRLQRAATATFPSMVLLGERSQLASVKAVTANYPLRGQLRVLQQGQEVVTQAPPPGHAYADPRLFDALGAAPGERVHLGAPTLTLAAVLSHEPDGALDLYNFVPRLIINRADLAATRLVQPGSRVRYRLLAAGSADQVDALHALLESKLQRGQRLEDIREARPELNTALNRAERFLRLSALMGVFLAAAAMALAARRYVERQLDAVALLRTLGQRQRQIIRLFLYQFGLLAVMAISLGVLLGWLAQFGLSQTLGGVFDTRLPPAGPWPGVAGAAVGAVLLFGFCVPPLLRLSGVPPLRVLRRDALPAANARIAFSLGALALLGLIAWQAADVKLAALTIAGLTGTIAIAALAAWALIWLVPHLPLPGGAGWRFGLANVARRRGLSVAQVVALALGLMALMLLTVVHNDLLAGWQRSLPVDAPNRFIINIQPEQRGQIADQFRAAKLPVPDFAPMIRSRLVAINGRPVRGANYQSEQAQRLAEREFNLSWGEAQRSDNKVIAGQPLDPAQPGWAVEEVLAKTLNIQLGDALTFDLGGSRYTAPVQALRKVSWDSFKVNFFVVGTRALLEKQAASYVTSFHLTAAQTGIVGTLTRAMPNLTVVDVSTLITEVRGVLDRVIAAVQGVFAFSLLAGLVVLYAATLSTHDERKHEAAILRTLGASRAMVGQAVSAELLLVGGLAGLLAAGAALAAGIVAASQLFDLPVQPSWWLLPAGLVGGALSARLAAAPLLRRVLHTPPLRALR